ncbi:hypothetical protein WH50_17475 [Pokkaliibacter plantistimulans]|uniref:Restriction endonuclease n=1 Tax=Pokkaliibacter plantistimulans TaxID=1635171 RepID=A0ABX5LV68_9GAMM|nr:hypothetical protein [Pokkaliibacter plantistimulans]PXF30044.1 hypothetical protein WH50_17475 [Pokkaliibacter plantistimulans]
MSSKPLQTQSLLDLIDLFERSGQPIADGDGQRLRGVPGWKVLGRTSLTQKLLEQWTDCVGYAGSYPASLDDDLIQVDLTEDDQADRYRYRCPETFRWKFVPAAEVAVYSVRPAGILSAIADLLGIAQALRKGIDAPLLDDALWHLGKARIGPALTDVWLVRGLTHSVEEVFRHFGQTGLPDQGLILSSGGVLPQFVRPPRSYRFASLREAIVDYVATPCIDMDLLHRILAAPPDGAIRPVLPVHFDEYTNTLTIRTKTKPWTIKGERQAAAVRYMFEQAINDRWILSAAEILDAAYADKKTARSQRMQNLFSGNTDWEDYIDNPEKGKYGFRRD